MIVKGIVVENFNLNTNKLKVQVPIFADNGNQVPPTLNCSVCYTPGSFSLYKYGDIVYIGFENNDFNNPIVLGKLYTMQDKDAVLSSANLINLIQAAKLDINGLSDLLMSVINKNKEDK